MFRKGFLMYLFAHIFLLLLGAVQPQIQCSAYNSTSNRYYLPSLGGRESVLNQIWISSPPGVTYIFPVISSSISCSGTLKEVEFCYSVSSTANYGSNLLVFYLDLLSLDGVVFTVMESLDVYSSPDGTKCRNIQNTIRCCDIVTHGEGIKLHPSMGSIAIGISIPPPSNINLQGFHSTNYAQGYMLNMRPIGTQFELNPALKSSFALRLVWFHVEPDVIQTSTVQKVTPTPSTAALPVTSPTHIFPSFTISSEPDEIQTSAVQIITPTPLSVSLPITSLKQIISPSFTISSEPDGIQTSAVQIITPTSSLSSLPITSPTQIISPSFVQIGNKTRVPKITMKTDISGILSSTSNPTLNPPTLANPNFNPPNNSSLNIAIGAAMVVGVVSLVLLISCTLVILFVIKRKKRVMKEISDLDGNSIGNAMYMYETTAVDKKNTGILNLSNDYSVYKTKPGLVVQTKCDDTKEDGYEYVPANLSAENRDDMGDYENAQPNASLWNSLSTKGDIAQTTSEYNHLKRRNNTTGEIYVVPPNNVSQLYGQLEEVKAKKLTRESLKLKTLLGSGHFGEVYQGVWNCLECRLEVAVKTLKENSSEQDRIKFLQEAAIMGQFRHANVVTLYGVISDREPILLVLEILKKGDLRKHLRSMRINGGNEISPELKEVNLLMYCRQIASGMKYLSYKTFIHRDLAARNILVSEKNICKIADFGMSRDLMDETYYVAKGGLIPVKWTAPEALHYKKYSTASDVWSYGVVMYEIWSVGHKPFEGLSNSKVIKIIDSGYRLPPPPGCPRSIYNIMMLCWAPGTSQRPTFSDIHSQLATSNSKLLHWSDECKAVSSSATEIGAELACASNLYKDLQIKYLNDQ